MTSAKGILQERVWKLKAYHGTPDQLTIKSPRYWSNTACRDALFGQLETMNQKRLELCLARLEHMSNFGTIEGRQPDDTLIPAYKITYKHKVGYIRVDIFDETAIKTVIANGDSTEAATNGPQGGVRIGAGRKRKIDKFPEAMEILTAFLQKYSAAHGRRRDEYLRVGVSARMMREELLSQNIDFSEQTIRYLMYPPHKGTKHASRYHGIIKGKVERSLKNDKMDSSTATPEDVHHAQCKKTFKNFSDHKIEHIVSVLACCVEMPI